MDGTRFDAFTQMFGAAASRRDLLKGLAGAALASIFASRRAQPVDAKSTKVGICYQTGNAKRPLIYLQVTAAAAQRLRGRRGFSVCSSDIVIDPATCQCRLPGVPGGVDCAYMWSACKDNADCCSDVCTNNGICNCGTTGKVCHDNGDCCGGPCLSGICACSGAADGCTQNSDCCSNICVGVACACAAFNVDCTRDTGCCSGICDSGKCACSGAGVACQGDSECCSNLCSDGLCACAVTGSSCQNGGDCCCGVCVSGACGCAEGTCQPNQVCVNFACCTPDCAGKTCGSDGCEGSCGPCCETGIACASDDDCCSGQCQGGVCACLEPGNSCQADTECCSNSCLEGKCTCLETGASCQSDGDCCSDICKDGKCGCTADSCPPQQVCVDGACCAPNCTNKSCGDDGCGGVCGTCPDGQACAPFQAPAGTFYVCGLEGACPADIPSCSPPNCVGPSKSQACFCSPTTSGDPACVVAIDTVTNCTSDSDCASGQVCAVTCVGNSCAPTCP
jgi:hypothetical protein